MLSRPVPAPEVAQQCFCAVCEQSFPREEFGFHLISRHEDLLRTYAYLISDISPIASLALLTSLSDNMYADAWIDIDGYSYEDLLQLCDLMGEASRPPPPPIDLVSTSTSVAFRCPICLNDQTGGQALNTCGHAYCRECITEWFKQRSTCPLCNADVRETA